MNLTQKKILVAIDGSDQSLDAVRYVGRVLASQKIEVVLFHVLREMEDSFRDMGMDTAFLRWISGGSSREIYQEKREERFMNHARQILLDAGFPKEAVTVNIHESKVGVARDIITESKGGYSAIVLGRKGLSKIHDLVLGSIANKLIEKLAHVPVWVVGGNPDSEKILLALDASQEAMKAVDHVGTMLGDSTFRVTLLHVVRDIDTFQKEDENSSTKEQEEWLKEAKLVMRPVFEEARFRLIDADFDPSVVTTRLITGASSRAGTIVEVSKHGGYGSIIIGRRGKSKIEEFVMGSVSNKVIHLAKDMAVWIVS